MTIPTIAAGTLPTAWAAPSSGPAFVVTVSTLPTPSQQGSDGASLALSRLAPSTPVKPFVRTLAPALLAMLLPGTPAKFQTTRWASEWSIDVAKGDAIANSLAAAIDAAKKSPAGDALSIADWSPMPDRLGLRFLRSGNTAAEPQSFPAMQSPSEALSLHRAACDKLVNGEVVFELFADINALRRESQGGFADGPESRILSVLRLSNARSLRIAGVLIPVKPTARTAISPQMLVLTISWASRSEALDMVRAVTLGDSVWPTDVPTSMAVVAPTSGPAAGVWNLAVRPTAGYGALGAGASGWVRAAASLYLASFSGEQAAKPAAQWLDTHTADLRKAANSTGRYVVLASHADGLRLTIPNATPVMGTQLWNSVRALLGSPGQGPKADEFVQSAMLSPAAEMRWVFKRQDDRVTIDLSAEPEVIPALR